MADTPSVSLAGIGLIRRAIEQLGPEWEPMSRADRFALYRAAADSAARLAGVLETVPKSIDKREPSESLQGFTQRKLTYQRDCVEFIARLREFAATPAEEKADG